MGKPTMGLTFLKAVCDIAVGLRRKLKWLNGENHKDRL